MTASARVWLALLAFLTVVGVSGRVGYTMCEARYLKELLGTEQNHTKELTGLIKQTSKDSNAAELRIAKLRQQQAQTLSRAEELKNEMAKLPRRVECDYSPDELHTLHGVYDELFPSHASSVSDRVQRSTDTNQSQTGLRVPTASLGTPVQRPAQ